MDKSNLDSKIIWEGDLKDDCVAKWLGLMLRAEWMDKENWWWAVYDHRDGSKEVDSSNNYAEENSGGDIARGKAEDAARKYIKNEIITVFKGSNQKDMDILIGDLKNIGISPMHTIIALHKEFDYDYIDAKNIVFDSPHWEGLRELSKKLTQKF